MAFIILNGNPSEGYKAIGPFSTFDDADAADTTMTVGQDDGGPAGNSWIMGVTHYPHWLNNGHQYPRLIEELQAAGAFTPAVMEALAKSMDLQESDIQELIERARNDWEECIKVSK